MFFSRLAAGVFELAVTVVVAVLVVYMTLRALIRANTDFNEDVAILKGNVAVGLLVGALLLASANIMHQAFLPVANIIHLYFSDVAGPQSRLKLTVYALGNLALAFSIVVLTLSFSLRLFGRLTRTKETRPGKELEKGNVAVGIVLSSVVLIVSLFVGEGVKAISKALRPKTGAAQMQIMR